MINEYDKGAAVMILNVFDRLYHVPFEGYCETALFRYLCKRLFVSP